MFNLNTPSSLLGIDGSGLSSTPKTPEIVNSLIAMTNPMDNYNFTTLNNTSTASTPGSVISMRNVNGATNAQIMSQDSSHSSSSTSPVDSPSGANTTTSVQQMCSQLIKAGLKLSIQSKRKVSTCDSSSGSDQPNSKYSRPDEEDLEDSTDDENECKATPKGLTPEDEDRRRRRRERNKIAATKCRMKKRERTQNLIKESEQLETTNIDLKTQVRALEAERRKLLDMLQCHATTCLHTGGLNLPSKLLQSPAHKYLAALEIENNGGSASISATTNGNQSLTHQQMHDNNALSQQSSLGVQRTVIPPMSTIKFSRSAAVNQQLHQLPTQQQQLPNGYCKPSPTPQELGYLASPSHESVCLPAILPQIPSQTSTTHQIGAVNVNATTVPSINQQLCDYIPNCENSLGLVLSHNPNSVQSNDDNSVLLGDIVSPLSVISTTTTATEFVKNELVDSQSPYTTAQSAERFLFENCESFVDIKHAVSLHHGCLNSNNNNSHNNNNNNTIASLHHSSNTNLLDFNTSLISSGGGIVPFHDQISIKNDYIHDTDLLAQLTGDGADFVDLDSSVAASFMTNNGCLA